MSKETRKERNRLAAKQSRDNKAAYIHELEAHLETTRNKCAILERELRSASQRMDAQSTQIATLRDIVANHTTWIPAEEPVFFMD